MSDNRPADPRQTVTARIAALIAQPRYQRLGRVIALTQAGMAAERLARAFWPFWTLLLSALAAIAFGVQTVIPPDWWWLVLVLLGGALGWLMLRGLRRLRLPAWTEAMARLDTTLPGRPLAALTDTQALGDDPQARAVWQAHLRRMAERAAVARAPAPAVSVADRDPYALRLMAVTAFVMALAFGAIWRVADMSEAAASAPLPGTPGGGPSWEGWVEPPLYTGLPSIYLNDLIGTEFSAPVGSEVTLRIYGDPDAVEVIETVSSLPVAVEDAPQLAAVRTVPLNQSGTLSIDGPGGRSFAIDIVPDAAPSVDLASAPEGVPPSQLQFEYAATDDYAVVRGEAVVQLNPRAAARRHGLAVDPEQRAPLVLDLPLPFAGGRDDFSEVFVDDLSEHPFANLPVTLTLIAADDLGQRAESTHAVARLPGRPFYVPLAAAIAEQRRDLLWSRANRARAARLLRAIRYRPDGMDAYRPDGLFPEPQAAGLVGDAIERLETAGPDMTRATRDEIADLLWQAALLVEDHVPETAEERLARAQERLAEAMRQGANEAEIAELMDQMREAMDEYMQQLADEFERDGTDRPDTGENGQSMSQMDLDEMMRRIEELMAQGRTAEAMALLEQLRQMMENMEIVEGEGEGDGPRLPGEQAMEDLQDTLRDQQDLSDDSFQELQDQFNPGRQQGQQQGQPQPGQQPGGQQQDQAGRPGGQQGGEAPGAPDPEALARRQQELRRQLEEQANRLPGAGTEEGDEARRRLEDAGRAMDEAAEALENDDLAGAIDRQAEAMEALREGLQSLGQALAQDRGERREDGPAAQGRADGDMATEGPAADRPVGSAGRQFRLARDRPVNRG